MSAAAFALLVIIIVANGAPVLLARVMGNALAQPIDNNCNFFDHRPLLGNSKTWRGLAVAIISSSVATIILDYSLTIGVIAGLLAMIGDLISSFCKRRLGMKSSSMAPLLDQIPEALLPALALQSTLHLSTMDVALIVTLFIVFELILSVIFYTLGIRNRPY